MSNCYNCKFRGTVPGSAHSSCKVVRTLLGDAPEAKVLELEMFLLLGKAKLTDGDEDAVKLNPHGVKNGWASWPFDFDPVWVEECKLFLSKEEEKE